jgi:hypothetical protein
MLFIYNYRFIKFLNVLFSKMEMSSELLKFLYLLIFYDFIEFSRFLSFLSIFGTFGPPLADS